MLRYSKKILKKVSFDTTLFKKELSKALALLSVSEQKELLLWVENKFTNYKAPYAGDELLEE